LLKEKINLINILIKKKNLKAYLPKGGLFLKKENLKKNPKNLLYKGLLNYKTSNFRPKFSFKKKTSKKLTKDEILEFGFKKRFPNYKIYNLKKDYKELINYKIKNLKKKFKKYKKYTVYLLVNKSEKLKKNIFYKVRKKYKFSKTHRFFFLKKRRIVSKFLLGNKKYLFYSFLKEQKDMLIKSIDILIGLRRRFPTNIKRSDKIKLLKMYFKEKKKNA